MRRTEPFDVAQDRLRRRPPGVASEGEPVFTIGHSNRSLEDFVALLWSNGIATLADVRRFPGSRKYPHFTVPAFGESLERCGIEYVHIPELGGRRRALPDTKNIGWRNAGFRGYADHMNTEEFARGLERLSRLSAPFAVMCSEAVPWRCHRWLLSDALLVRGAEVLHIIGPGAPRKHKRTAFARRRGDRLVYGESGH